MAVVMEIDKKAVVTFEGRVLSKREYNGYDDSDFYALVWDDETGRTREVCYATTRGWTYNNGATIDATDEVLEKYAAFLLDQRVALMKSDDLDAATQITRGSEVTMNRTMNSRKVGKLEKGLTGRVFWIGRSDYGPGYRAGVEFSDGRKHFLDTNDLAVTPDKTKLRSDEDLREYAECEVERTIASIKSMRKVLVAA